VNTPPTRVPARTATAVPYLGRTMPTRHRTRAAVVLLLLPLALAGCAGGGGGEQDSPEAVTAAAYRHIAAGEFEKTCDLYLPAVRSRFTTANTDCQSYLAKTYADRAGFAEPEVDGAKVETDGDTAVVPRAAVSFGGRPSRDTETKAVRQDGKWWLAG
jgi:hypothetical protein